MKMNLLNKLRRFADGDFSLEPKEKIAPLRRPQRHQERTILQRLSHWNDNQGSHVFSRFYNAISVLICLGMIAVLLVAVSFLPPFGDPTNPVNNEVSERYIQSGIEETGAVNFVAGMILDYRAFDTLGESAVLLVASVSVFMLMANMGKKNLQGSHAQYQNIPRDPIVKTVAKYIIPFLLMFGIYVVLNGHISPGGGFAGGAIMGAGLILYASSYGLLTVQKVLTHKRIQRVTFCSLLFYVLAKSYSFFTGAHHMETGIPLGEAGSILSAGLILPLNICVGLIVTCTMYSFYALYTAGKI